MCVRQETVQTSGPTLTDLTPPRDRLILCRVFVNEHQVSGRPGRDPSFLTNVFGVLLRRGDPQEDLLPPRVAVAAQGTLIHVKRRAKRGQSSSSSDAGRHKFQSRH